MTKKDKNPTDKIFLSAQWKWLAMFNWEVDPAALEEYVPNGTTLDFHLGKTYISIVGFMFLNTKVLGIPIPFHRNFEELNLRFYVCREEQGELRRGVSFISEFVPKWAIATTARWGYNENYRSVPMKHQINAANADNPIDVNYSWKTDDHWNHISAQSDAAAIRPEVDSVEQFIAEHYWGYSQQRDGSTFEYRVRHEPWNVWHADQFDIQSNCGKSYGEPFSSIISQTPASVFIADGSEVTVSRPRRIRA